LIVVGSRTCEKEIMRNEGEREGREREREREKEREISQSHWLSPNNSGT